MLATLSMTAAFVGVLAYFLTTAATTDHSPLRRVPQPSAWMRPPDDETMTGYFRWAFELPGEVKHAWVHITAVDAYEINVNRNPLGRVYLWRPTRPFQNGTSEKGQVLSPQDPAMALNFPREHQWDGHDNWRLPNHVELTSALRPGRNVIAIEVESRSMRPRVGVVGEIQMHGGQVIPIRAGPHWKSEPVPPGLQTLDWTEPLHRDGHWRTARVAQPPVAEGHRSYPVEIYTRPMAGTWMRHPRRRSGDDVVFTTTWDLPDRPIDEGYVRVLTNRGYEIRINGVRVRVPSTRPPDLDNGRWIFGRGAAHDPTTKPELLDPDEVGSTFIGTRFESPRTADGKLETFRDPFAPAVTPFRYIRTTNRAQEAGVIDPKRTMAESRRTPKGPDVMPERPAPNSLKRDRATGGYLAYTVNNLLHPGPNHVEVRCLASEQSNWPARIAVDGAAFAEDGTRTTLPDVHRWKAKHRSAGPADAVPVEPLEPAVRTGLRLPRMQYRGPALHPQSFDVLLPRYLLASAAAVGGLLSFSWILAPFAFRNRDRRDVRSAVLSVGYSVMLTATIGLAAYLLVECSFVERHETIWCTAPDWAWGYPLRWWVLAGVAAVAATVGAIDVLGRLGLNRLRDRTRCLSTTLRELPHGKLWVHAIIWTLMLGALLRGYKLDLQPLDDDEYASTQAVLAIMETGAPGFVPDDVFYTRSPAYHYVTAILALPFGGDLWTFRWQSVGWSLATMLLTYECGRRLLDSRWVGMIAMLLVGVHPFEIFTGHVIRFYQMQQFFALLTMYAFCRGFVEGKQSQGWRVATLLIFFFAVISQEITVAMGPSLVFGYLVFGKDFGWRKNLQLVFISAAVVGGIVIDFVVFQTLCLTRTEGVSPSIEASVKPHFWYPMNLLAIFIGYSRLHVVPSVFFFAGLPLLWRSRNRSTLAMTAFLVSGVLMTNVLVTNVSLRYMYWLFPVWVVMCVAGMRALLSALVAIVHPPDRRLNRYVVTLGACCSLCVVAILASWSLWRIPGSYELRILGDSTGAMRFVKSQKRPGDRIAVTEPHTHCAFLEGGGCDYDVALPLLYDFAVMREGKLVDRNGGGLVVSSIDQLMEEFSAGHRIWVLLNREKFRTRGKNMRWEYPGARFEMFLRKNCELRHRTYLWSVYLWDPAKGHYDGFRPQQ